MDDEEDDQVFRQPLPLFTSTPRQNHPRNARTSTVSPQRWGQDAVGALQPPARVQERSGGTDQVAIVGGLQEDVRGAAGPRQVTVPLYRRCRVIKTHREIKSEI